MAAAQRATAGTPSTRPARRAKCGPAEPPEFAERMDGVAGAQRVGLEPPAPVDCSRARAPVLLSEAVVARRGQVVPDLGVLLACGISGIRVVFRFPYQPPDQPDHPRTNRNTRTIRSTRDWSTWTNRTSRTAGTAGSHVPAGSLRRFGPSGPRRSLNHPGYLDHPDYLDRLGRADRVAGPPGPTVYPDPPDHTGQPNHPE